MAPRDDLGKLYAKHMEHFGCGTAMFQPVAAADMKPPCIGYLDDNMRWNLIATIEWIENGIPKNLNIGRSHSLKLLERSPKKLEQLGIEWRPRTSTGVRQWTVDASGQTPDTGLPAGADGHIRYQSKGKFGAVLIARKPITLTSYNDETLFQSWLAANKSRLSSLYGNELRRYGLRLITRTYTCPGCSINAWHSKDRETTMTVKAKANMLGELGGDLEWTERLSDKDWSHYFGRGNGDTIVVFFDGIEVPASTWWLEGLKGRFGKQDVSQRRSEVSSFYAYSGEHPTTPLRSPKDMAGLAYDQDKGLVNQDLWGSTAPLAGRNSSVNSRNGSRGRQPSKSRDMQMNRSMSTPKRLSKHLDYNQRSSATHDWAERPSIRDVQKNKAVSPPAKAMGELLGPASQCLSPASYASSQASVKIRKPTAMRHKPDKSRADSEPESTSSRHPPRKRVNWSNDRSSI
ncbi:hypothetical protein ACLMJK_005952 [Lecanora helva]